MLSCVKTKRGVVLSCVKIKRGSGVIGVLPIGQSQVVVE